MGVGGTARFCTDIGGRVFTAAIGRRDFACGGGDGSRAGAVVDAGAGASTSTRLIDGAACRLPRNSSEEACQASNRPLCRQSESTRNAHSRRRAPVLVRRPPPIGFTLCTPVRPWFCHRRALATAPAWSRPPRRQCKYGIRPVSGLAPVAYEGRTSSKATKLAYRCGGSAGFPPASRFVPRDNARKA